MAQEAAQSPLPISDDESPPASPPKPGAWPDGRGPAAVRVCCVRFPLNLQGGGSTPVVLTASAAALDKCCVHMPPACYAGATLHDGGHAVPDLPFCPPACAAAAKEAAPAAAAPASGGWDLAFLQKNAASAQAATEAAAKEIEGGDKPKAGEAGGWQHHVMRRGRPSSLVRVPAVVACSMLQSSKGICWSVRPTCSSIPLLLQALHLRSSLALPPHLPPPPQVPPRCSASLLSLLRPQRRPARRLPALTQVLTGM